MNDAELAQVYRLGRELGLLLFKIKALTPASPRRKPLLAAIQQNMLEAGKLGVQIEQPDTGYDPKLVKA